VITLSFEKSRLEGSQSRPIILSALVQHTTQERSKQVLSVRSMACFKDSAVYTHFWSSPVGGWPNFVQSCLLHNLTGPSAMPFVHHQCRTNPQPSQPAPQPGSSAQPTPHPANPVCPASQPRTTPSLLADRITPFKSNPRLCCATWPARDTHCGGVRVVAGTGVSGHWAA